MRKHVLLDDRKGETKIIADGDLSGGREFLVCAFTLTEKGSHI